MFSTSSTVLAVEPGTPTPTDDPTAAAADLLASSPAGLVTLATLAADLTRAAADGTREQPGPLPSCSPAELAERVRADLVALSTDPRAGLDRVTLDAIGAEPTGADPDSHGLLLPRRGAGVGVVSRLVRRYAGGTVRLSDPAAAAHLQPPALTVAVATEMIAAAFNASVDTWDSGPYAMELEKQVVAALVGLLGYPATGTGVLTSGGTASNLHALLLARDAAARRRFGIGMDRQPWPAGYRPVVYCSEAAHFSTAQACAVLGLGRDAVRTVPVDGRFRMRTDVLAAELAALPADAVPVAIVATAGTTDFGSIDPLSDCRDLADRYDAWLHVDAAYGGGALFSDRLRPLLSGVDSADSVTLDLHKIGWQPAAASALLVRRRCELGVGRERVAYLNPEDDGAAGYDGLLERSLATTRRADALKIAATFLALGRQGLGRLLDACHDLARYAERRILDHPRLELAAGATLSTVVFRYRTADAERATQVNGALRRRLLRAGTALIGRTEIPGRGTYLKLTLLNPTARRADVDRLLDAVLAAGDREVAA
ncbi:MAG: pyridoxal-dependent decarboxylase [Actinocatenispora sp.]